ncbi:hypothetical protein E1292_28240 [Nonomuraea deserti]|uniref:Small secreted hydrophilic protein n=1 Tax=Nonomuraea deserti TaxID=1848322 RepID=A0A4V2Y9P5_9ACTN|nr:hypothetical protein [Nonomuraea deserti]TDD00636.1 hypothetical protein E1292_28240 [Nonomuraea deserti]
MKQRGTVILLVLAAAVAGFMSVGLVQAAEEPDLGGPVVVTPSPDGHSTYDPRTSDPTPSGQKTSRPAVSGSPSKNTPRHSAGPTPRRTKAEPVRPPSPRPGGGDDDDDDDDGDDGGGDDD